MILPGVIIRGDSGKIKIGKRTNIQDNSVVHSDADSWIGDDSTIGHGVVWHGRILSNNCLVGNGAVVNDGVEVGELSIIAAGSVVLEETRILFESDPHSEKKCNLNIRIELYIYIYGTCF